MRIELGDQILDSIFFAFKDDKPSSLLNLALCYRESSTGFNVDCARLESALAKIACDKMEEMHDSAINFKIHLLRVPDELLLDEEGELRYKPAAKHFIMDIWCSTWKYRTQNLISLATTVSFCVGRMKSESFEEDYLVENQGRYARYHKGYIIITGNHHWGNAGLLEKITSKMPSCMMIKGVINTQCTDASLQWWKPGVAGTYSQEQ